MASSTVSNKCVASIECKKNGIIKCDGCSTRFCSDHFPVHRRELEALLELLCSDRDQFYHVFTQTLGDPTELLTQIDRWEQQTLDNVKKTASNARDQIHQLTATKPSNREFEKFSEELRWRKESEDYFEHDIERLQQQLEQIKSESKTSSDIDILYAPINWETMIQVNHKNQQQPLGQLVHDTLLLHPKQEQSQSCLSLGQQQIVNEFCGRPNQQWLLIYRGTRHGFGKGDFLRHCANQGPTITLIVADTYLFGGYTSTSWKNTNETIWDIDPSAFLFTLTNPHQIPPTKYPIMSSADRAIRSDSWYGSTFGQFDICVHLDSNKNTRNNIGFPKNYRDLTRKGMKTFTGNEKFQTSEIEVYKQI